MSVTPLRLHESSTSESPASSGSVATPPVAAQPDVIDAYWDDVKERVGYLLPLLDAGRNNEAMTLCATYLEAVAHSLVSANGASAGSFADEAEEHASDPYLTLVHPLQLVRIVSQLPGLSPSAVYGLAATFPGPEYRLLYQDQATAIIRATLAPTDAELVERAIWKGTVAYVIYDFVRTQSFKRREGTRSIGLGLAFHEGSVAQSLSVPELVSMLESMVAEARARSHATRTLPQG